MCFSDSQSKGFQCVLHKQYFPWKVLSLLVQGASLRSLEKPRTLQSQESVVLLL